MIATMAIEFSLAAYAVWRYRMTEITRLIVLLLVGLGTFQVAEYFVCTGPGPQALPWSRLGFAAITTLPPLGLHLMHSLAGSPNRRVVKAGYGMMVAFMGFFLLSPNAFAGHQCTGNYVIFQFSSNVTGLYSFYYYGLIALGVGYGWRWARQFAAQGQKMQHRREMVQGLIAGYLIFLVPVAVVNTISPDTRRGIPSILCGFAVLLALNLALYVLPRTGDVKESAAKRAI